MFVEAIKECAKFTKQFRTITRNFGSDKVNKGAASLIVINNDGWILTCKHVANNIYFADQFGKSYRNYKAELSQGLMNEATLRQKYNYQLDKICQLKNQFFDVFSGNFVGVKVIPHKKMDIALIKIEGDIKMACDHFPVFSQKMAESGMSLCKLGFPFAEYTCVEYNVENDDIFFTNTGKIMTPFFPLDGMVTRTMINADNQIFGFEMSTPGIKGQSGGPVFDKEGLVYGMQYQTHHLDLDFKLVKQINKPTGIEEEVNYAFMNVGNAISSTILIEFMKENHVVFQSR
ncbi:MAG: serine protease [Candidatus Izemoplasmatales bacterium]|jgi:hypothetical protein|nr:serine protease [Candidatus Izemoplasmatales bacterium]MDD3865540.1 serine protease [Candidatus Izemoplasmatales bacterium]